ncbi:MAG: YqaE/Pmp3 family membrane protein [Bacteroidota bacterium]|jgi:uncharacterized membrane protein YqaE (UPF0057 family)
MRSLILFISWFIILSPSASSAIVRDPSVMPTTSVTNSVDKKVKKQKLAAFKKRLKSLKKYDNANDRMVLLVILAVIIPPLAVYLHQDEINIKFWVSILLTLCFWIPGVIYSLLVVLDAI